MICPMTFGDGACREGCAWRLANGDAGACAVAVLAVALGKDMLTAFGFKNYETEGDDDGHDD